MNWIWSVENNKLVSLSYKSKYFYGKRLLHCQEIQVYRNSDKSLWCSRNRHSLYKVMGKSCIRQHLEKKKISVADLFFLVSPEDHFTYAHPSHKGKPSYFFFPLCKFCGLYLDVVVFSPSILSPPTEKWTKGATHLTNTIENVVNSWKLKCKVSKFRRIADTQNELFAVR